MFHGNPSLMSAGAVAVISPDGSHRLPPDLWAEYAAIVLLEPEPELLGSWVRRLEDGLGVSDLHRAIVSGGEPAARAHIRAGQVARGLVADERAPRKTQLPKSERGRTADDLRQIDRLRAKLARKDLKKEAREKAETELQRLLDAPQRKADEAWQDQSSRETMRLAVDRGEEAHRVKSGAVHIPDRDPLLALMRAGRLTAPQFDAALECRACYEARSEDVGSQMGALGAGAPHNNDKFVHNRLQRAKKLQRLGTIERAVAVQCTHEPAALMMLRGVCGQNISLSHYGEGRAFARNLAAFVMALDVIADLK